MHICFITSEFPKTSFPHGGVGIFVHTLGRALIEKGIRVTVIGINYFDKEEVEIIEGIEVVRIAKRKIKYFTWLYNSIEVTKKIKNIHQKNPIDIVETAELGLAFLRKIINIKYVIRMHGGHHFLTERGKRSMSKSLQEKLSFKKADALIAVSNFVKNETNKSLDFNVNNVNVIPNPISTTHFKPSNIDFDEYSIVFVGTVYPKKGVENLIKAFALVQKKFPQAYLNIYGREWYFNKDISYTEFLKSKFSNKSLKNVIFHGVIEHKDLPNIYQSAHICVFPSLVESQGIVIIEAMASEKVVLFSKIPVGYETITSFENGILIDQLDPTDIAKNIIWVFENSKEAEIIGKKARQSVVDKFDIQKIVVQNIEFYTTLNK
jgi:glycosyltransferase involved in cell wall biosynthesis